MNGGRRGFASVNVFFLSILIACGGGREAGAPPAAGSGDTVRSANPDTVANTIAARSDTAATAAKPGAGAGETPPRKTTPPRQPATPAEPKPAPGPRPAASEPFGTKTPAAPADTTPTAPAPAETSAPLRDAYHMAPIDTVPQQVYDGWKQYNLNCARCHGEDVQGTTIAPHLIVSVRPEGPVPTKELFMQTVCAGRPEKGMPAWCPLGLEMSKIEAMYLYVKGRSEGKIHQGRPALKQ